MRLCAERAGFEDDLYAVSRVGQAGIKVGLAGAAEYAGFGQVVGRCRLNFGQVAADKTDIASRRIWTAKLLDVPLPVPVLSLCGKTAQQ